MLKKTHELKGHDAGIYALAYDAAHQTLYSGGGDKMLATWSLESYMLGEVAIKSLHSIYSICVLEPLNQCWIGQSQGGIHVIDEKNKKEIKYFDAHPAAITHLHYSVAHQKIIASVANGEVSIWDPHNLVCIQKLKLSDAKIRKMHIAEEILYIPCQDGFIYRLNLLNLTLLPPIYIENSAFNCCLYLPHKQTLLAGRKDALFSLFILEDHGWKHLGTIPAHNYAIYELALSPCGQYIASASRDKSIKIWDAKSLDLIEKLDFKQNQGHTHSVNTLLWAEQGLISGGDDRKILVWK